MNGAEAVAASPIAGELRRVVGEAAVEEGSALWRYAASGVVPGCVVKPASVEELAAAVRTVAAARGAIVPTGNANHLLAGAPPRRYDVALSTARLDRIVAHDAADMTVTVEAGASLAKLDEALAAAGQWLPLDPPRAAEASVGGLIAADRNGPLRFTHGKVRDLLIGIAVVTATGTLVRGGGRVVKNVAGYDLPKLFAGSHGTLGVIVEATFKVWPRPAETRMFVWPARSIDECLARALALRDTAVHPAFLEVLNEPAADSVGLEPGPCLVVGCSGSATELESAEASLVEASGRAAWRVDAGGTEPLYRALRDSPMAANDDALVARISTLPSELAPLLARLESEAAARRVLVEIGAHAGNGVAWCQFLGSADPHAVAWFAEWLRIQARTRRAWVVFESLPPALRARVDPWGFSGPVVRLMSGIKRALDPNALFSPGRFVGGI